MTRHDAKAETAGARTPRIVRTVVIGILLIIVAPIVAFMIAYMMVDVPKADQLVTKQVSEIYAADNQTELARIVPPEGNRVQVSIDEIPDSMKSAAIAAEDREFYSNPGFSVTGFGRAVIGQLTGDASKGGGSTITQQYVKVAVVGNERTYVRKLKELVYAAKMANEWSKDQVLESYLNTIYLGRNAYGVAAASQAYFGKDFKELTPSESAMLAALIQRPSALDPWTNRPAAEKRWNYVLNGMVETGALTPQDRAGMVFPDVVDPNSVRPATVAEGTNGLIKNRVIEELNGLGITEQDVQTRGLRVTTTIDPVAQQAAVDAVHSKLEGEPENLRSAVVSVDPKTGGVSAYFGGDDGAGWDYANAGLQTGSTFKIFTLAAALEQGIPVSALYDSSPVNTGNVTVTNVGGETCGVCSLAQALKHSFNTTFIRLQKDLKNGPQDTADMAHKLGVAESIPGVEHTLTENGGTPFEGIALGQYQTRPLDMAVALATLANEGVYHTPHFVQKVETVTGDVLYEHKPSEGERRVSAEVANAVIAAMKPIAAYSNGHALAGRESAAKTGTAQLGDTGQNKDAWMIGATPQLATAVWVGTQDNSPLLNLWGGPVWGAGLPSDIWKATMDSALADKDVETFNRPGELGYVAPDVVRPAPTTSSTTTEETTSETPKLPELPEVPLPVPVPLPENPGVPVPAPGNPAPAPEPGLVEPPAPPPAPAAPKPVVPVG